MRGGGKKGGAKPAAALFLAAQSPLVVTLLSWVTVCASNINIRIFPAGIVSSGNNLDK
jgi:hypothetical protein